MATESPDAAGRKWRDRRNEYAEDQEPRVSRVIQSRTWWSLFLSIPVGVVGLLSWRFPEENSLLQLVLLRKPFLFYAIKYAYVTMLFSTPFIAFSTLLSLLYIFFARREKPTGEIRLPNYPEPEGRDALYLVVGEVHHAKRPEPVENPRWLVIPDRGLFTGIAIFGAIGTGKTTGCMYPFGDRSEEHTSELQSRLHLVCRLLLEKKKQRPRALCSIPP